MSQEEQEEMSTFERNLSAVDSFGGDQLGRKMTVIGEDPLLINDPEGEDRRDTLYSKQDFDN